MSIYTTVNLFSTVPVSPYMLNLLKGNQSWLARSHCSRAAINMVVVVHVKGVLKEIWLKCAQYLKYVWYVKN